MVQVKLTKKSHRATLRMPSDMVELLRYKIDDLIDGHGRASSSRHRSRKFAGHRFYVDEWHVLYEINAEALTIISCQHRSARRCIEMTVQIIERDRRPEWAVLPYELYQQLLDDSEMLQDIRDYEDAKKGALKRRRTNPQQCYLCYS